MRISLSVILKSKVPLSQVGQLARRNVRIGINMEMRMAREIVRKRVPQNRSGRHPARLYETVDLQLATVSTNNAHISTANPVWPLYEEDTKAHIILPKTKRTVVNGRAKGGVLVFKVGRSGKPVFTTKVNHPGTKGHHYWQEANEFLERTHPLIMKEAVEAAFRGQELTAGSRVSTSGPIPVRL
jgi:hypothetical protein